MGDVERHRFKAGDVIFTQEDDPRGEAYVIHSGAVEIRTRINGADRVLNRLGVGELFGVLALFLRSPRSASAVAVSDTELLIIKNERLEWLIFNPPQLTMEILKHQRWWSPPMPSETAAVERVCRRRAGGGQGQDVAHRSSRWVRGRCWRQTQHLATPRRCTAR
jgi:hypothetical protein